MSSTSLETWSDVISVDTLNLSGSKKRKIGNEADQWMFPNSIRSKPETGSILAILFRT